MDLALVVAMDEDRGIGRGGDLPWRLPGDMAHFRRVTKAAPEGKRNAVVMGRRTWVSIPERFRPLKGRLNLVLSRRGIDVPGGVLSATSFDDALAQLAARPEVARVFAIGGASVYASALSHPACRRLYITEVEGRFECDTFFPPLGQAWTRASRSEVYADGEVHYRFAEWVRAAV